MTRRLGAWDCTYCNTKKILGNIFDCPGCGHPRPRGVRFYQIPDGPIVTPEIAEQLGSGGPNWYCEHCDSGNKDNNNKCWNCGAERGSSPSHEVKKYLQGHHVPQNSNEAEIADLDGESWVTPQTPHRQEPSVPTYVSNLGKPSTKDTSNNHASLGYLKRARNLLPENIVAGSLKPYTLVILVIVCVVLLSILIYQFFFNSHEEMVRVSSFHWNQSVIVQEYQVTHESSWTTHPSSAYNVTSDLRDTGRDEKVHDGWEPVEYQDTCYETVSYQDTCTDSEYVSKTCTGTQDNGDGSFETYDYECGGYESYTYSCTKTREDPYSCTKTRQEELYHYEDIYDWYYEYDINKWITIANYPTSGKDHEPYFYNSFVLNTPYDGVSSPQLGQQQQFQVPGNYSITFFCKDNTKIGEEGYFTREYPLKEWELFRDEVNYPIKVNSLNGILNFPIP